MRTRPQRDHVLGDLDLTPNDARALSALALAKESGGGRTMRSLADEWGCDASNVTWIVGRLEERGLVRRRPDSRDGRVKLVVLTAEGGRTWKRVLDRMWTLPPALVSLSRADLEALRKALARLPGDD